MRFSRAPAAAETGLKGVAGIDRVTILPGKTYLRGWAGYGDPPRSNQNRPRQDTAPPAAPAGPAPTAMWTKESGPGEVKFADPKALDHHRDLLHARRLRASTDRRQRRSPRTPPP